MKSERKKTRKRWMRVFPEVHLQNGTNWYSWKRSAENTRVNIQAYCAGVFIIVHINRRSLPSLGSLRPVFLPGLAPDLLSCNRLKQLCTLHNDLSTVQSPSKWLGTYSYSTGNWTFPGKLNLASRSHIWTHCLEWDLWGLEPAADWLWDQAWALIEQESRIAGLMLSGPCSCSTCSLPCSWTLDIISD